MFKNILKVHSSTPIYVQALAIELSSHLDSVFTDHLLSGLSRGFQVVVVSIPDSSYVLKNLQSTVKDPKTMSQLLGKELNEGYLIGPFDSTPFPVSGRLHD